MNQLYKLPCDILSHIYSFDDTYRNKFNTIKFRLNILLHSGAAFQLINKYIQELFDANYVWNNDYGTFGFQNETREWRLFFYPEHKLFVVQDDILNRICFKIRPLVYDIDINVVEKRFDGFLIIDTQNIDDTYIGADSYQIGGQVHLYVDDEV